MGLKAAFMFQAYIPNLIHRIDRKSHIISQFENKMEFSILIVPPLETESGALSLWRTVQQTIKKKVDKNLPFFILCEDDHEFTEDYNLSLIEKCVKEVQILEADILLGGITGFEIGIQISQNLFWVEKFSGLQFTIIFKKFYQKILDVTDFGEHDAADYKISELTDKKFVIYPFISIQKDFGYSDVTPKNNQEGRVEKLFEDTSERFELLKKVRSFYLPDFEVQKPLKLTTLGRSKLTTGFAGEVF